MVHLQAKMSQVERKKNHYTVCNSMYLESIDPSLVSDVVKS